MKPITTIKFPVGTPAGGLFLLLLATAIPASAQEALQSALEGDRAYAERTSAEYRQRTEWLRTGPVAYTLSLRYGLEWNDNINYTNTAPASDFIHTPQANLRAFWTVTDESTISVGLGAGYQIYTEHSGLDHPIISPDSELAWDLTVKDCVFTVYDRFQYSRDVATQGALSGVAEFPRLENTAGLRARWKPSRYVLEAGYGHFNFHTDSQDFNYLNRAAEQFFARAGYRVAEITQAGVEASASFTTYDLSSWGDSRNLSAGPYVDWQLTEATHVALRGGWVWDHFDADAVSATARDLTSWYVGGDIRNQLTDSFSHSLSVSRQVEQGLNRGSDTVELLSVRYFLSWAFHQQGTLMADALYEHSSEPQFGEDYDRFGFGLAGVWQWTTHFSTGLGYRWVNKNSNLPDRDYAVNSVTLNVSYRF